MRTNDSEKARNYDGILKVLTDLLDDVNKLQNMATVVVVGLGLNQKFPGLVEALKGINIDHNQGEDFEEIINRHAKLAEEEEDQGYPFLYSQASIMLYSNLEACIKRIVITYFRHNNLTEIKEVSNLKITVAEYYNLDDDDRYDYLFQQYEKSITIGIQYGVTRFESLLKPIGLSGPMTEEVSKTIFELSQIRNVLLHRGSIADRHFIKSCPWVAYNLGDSIKVDRDQYNRFTEAVGEYFVLLVERLRELKAIPPRKSE
ncbi:hypothetical protein ACFSJU_14800 [Paradesertivirga mongoliensis]|uniref:RiboL-PSP-HEPN domain-containing protein n=1 Tax=Paradesertivirga mongoliensis TaxID=2100740 RepID=A0ABW4ZPB1_9SPHI|nr:hypothetical protein [Pedobacter mongoliensis]